MVASLGGDVKPFTLSPSSTHLTPNLYPVDSAIGFPNTYPLDVD